MILADCATLSSSLLFPANLPSLTKEHKAIRLATAPSRALSWAKFSTVESPPLTNFNALVCAVALPPIVPVASSYSDLIIWIKLYFLS